jgi:prevent-host-death family protein
MKIASVAEVKSQFSAYLKAAEGGPVVVTKNGKAVAVLVGVKDEEEVETLLMAYSPRLRAVLDASRKEIEQGAGVPHDEFWAEADPAAKKGPPRAKRSSG